MSDVVVEHLEPRQFFALGIVSEQIIVDQFGWRSAARKVVIFADPVNGQNAAVAYTAPASFEVRRASDDGLVRSDPVIAWKGGTTTHTDSGDRVWWGDFSQLTTPGEYYLYDATNNLRSYNFRIDGNLFNDILKTSVRTYYYQRTGTAIPASFGGNWTHAIDHVGPNQDTQARQWASNGTTGGPVVGSTVRNLSGGWFDAGDYNKYVPFTTNVIWNLLSAFEWNGGAFADNWNIPESGNKVPDLLDEVKYELDWLLKMQLGNGSVLNRVSNSTYNAGNFDPSTDTQARYYTAATTWATASFAASLAHASRVFAAYEPAFPGYAATLLTAAQNAWTYLGATPTMTPASGTDGGGSGGTNGGLASAGADGNAGMDFRLRVLAAAELYKTTGAVAGASYKSYFEANYKNAAGMENGFHPLLDGWPHFDASLGTELNRAYVTYATTPGASGTIVAEIKQSLRNMADDIIVTAYDRIATSAAGEVDPYRGFMWTGHYSWGSNQLKSEWANLLLYAARLNVNAANTGKYREVAEEYLHYVHGRNPLSQVYLSNMGTKGASLGGDKSVMQPYHSWFGDGSALYDGAGSTFGPIPGYLVGGANVYFSVGSLNPPAGQPAMKAFRDWNTGWPENSWEITEPAIYYQAAYTLLLSAFATDVAAPQVFSAGFSPAQPMNDQYKATFNEPLSSATLVLQNITTGQTIATTYAFDTGTNTATFTYASGLLPDGLYSATVTPTDTGGNVGASHMTQFIATRGTAGADRYEVRINGGTVTVARTNNTPITINPPPTQIARIVVRTGGEPGDTLAVIGTTAAQNFTYNPASVVVTGAMIEYAGVDTRLFDGRGGGDSLILNEVTIGIEGTQKIFSFGMDVASKIDVRDQDLIFDYTGSSSLVGTLIGSNYTGISGLVSTGRIFSSLATPSVNAIGVADASNVLGIGASETKVWSGMTTDGSAVLVKYTYAGDANLDGLVSGDDYSAIDFNIATPGAFAWLNGDFNYDSIISGDDYSVIDFAIAAQGAPL